MDDPDFDFVDETEKLKDNLQRAQGCADRNQPQTATAFALIDIATSLRKLVDIQASK
jgi:hypothetical protein